MSRKDKNRWNEFYILLLTNVIIYTLLFGTLGLIYKGGFPIGMI